MVPLVVLPVLVFVTVLAMELLMLLVASAVLLVNGISASALWMMPWLQALLTLGYALVVHALWYAPVYGWLLMVSAWARRSATLWATLPLLLASVVERISLGTSTIGGVIRYRLTGGFMQAFKPHFHGEAVPSPLTLVDAPGLIGSPGLWVGLLVAAVFLAVAVWLRRSRESS
jgi:ABC-2 type transport system permease protein